MWSHAPSSNLPRAVWLRCHTDAASTKHPQPCLSCLTHQFFLWFLFGGFLSSCCEEYFSQHLGEYENVLAALEDLNCSVLKAMDKTKKVRHWSPQHDTKVCFTKLPRAGVCPLTMSPNKKIKYNVLYIHNLSQNKCVWIETVCDAERKD